MTEENNWEDTKTQHQSMKCCLKIASVLPLRSTAARRKGASSVDLSLLETNCFKQLTIVENKEWFQLNPKTRPRISRIWPQNPKDKVENFTSLEGCVKSILWFTLSHQSLASPWLSNTEQHGFNGEPKPEYIFSFAEEIGPGKVWISNNWLLYNFLMESCFTWCFDRKKTAHFVLFPTKVAGNHSRHGWQPTPSLFTSFHYYPTSTCFLQYLLIQQHFL